MSEDNRNLVALKEAYRLWHDTKGGSVDHWLNLMTDDVIFRSLADGARNMELPAYRVANRTSQRISKAYPRTGK